MQNKRSFRLLAAGAVIIGVALFTASALQDRAPALGTRPKPEKLCPITFHLDPVTSLQRNFAAQTEKTNAIVAAMIVKLRAWIGDDKRESWKKERESFIANCQGMFKDTYLKKPVLVSEDGRSVTGWGEIIDYLIKIIPYTTYLDVQSVHVYLEYLPLNSPKYKTYNTDIKKPEEEIDFLATIRTVLAYAPYDDPILLGNEDPIPHRRVCDPIY